MTGVQTCALPIFSALILVLLAIPLSFVDPRAGRSLNLIFALVVYVIYNNILSIFQAWVTQGRLSASIGLWPVHAFFALLVFYMFYRRNHLLPLIPKFTHPEFITRFLRWFLDLKRKT